MDWSSSQWKEGLSSAALQKVNALEEKIEKLQKERQQKQNQFECLELLLDKEKRKVEQEKQQTSRLERELQSLADTCKNLETKQQKLLNEIQNRDSRQNILEAQLATAKKQNCRLQQLEKDIEELRCLRDSTKLEQKELEEKLKKEQSTIVKQSDAISDLEQTIKSLQEKSFNSSLLVVSDKSLTVDANKENIDSLKSVSDDKYSESLKKKILEQDNIINSLKEQLKNVSSSKEKMGPPSDILTPLKSNSSETSTKNTFNFWENFGSTPSKVGKSIKHRSDSSFDDGDEKVRNLHLKIKQLSQELECQRHNSEAVKNALEQRLKEKENILKAEIKQQAQTILDLDKELREMQSKYQQDVVQANKKLDILNAQLQKSESAKQQLDKDLKALELQINARNAELQQKDDELKDLHKVKNNLEIAIKKMQSEKREMEQNNNVLQAQRDSWNEEIKDLKMQLEGSNNLVKEKETLLNNMKKENDIFSKVNLELQTKIQTINKELSTTQTEKCNLEKQLLDLDASVLTLKENLKIVSQEKQTTCSLLDLEKNKSDKLEHDLIEYKKNEIGLQSEIIEKEKIMESMKIELEQLKNTSNVKIQELENCLSSSNAEISSLKEKLNDYYINETTMQERMKQMTEEYDEISKSLKVVSSEKASMQSHIQDLVSQVAALQAENKSKDEKITLLKKESVDFKVKIQELENCLSSSKAEISSLTQKLNEYATSETSIRERMKQMTEEYNEISKSLKIVNSEKASMESHIQDLVSQLAALQTENKTKDDNIILLKKETADLKEIYSNKIQELENCLCSSNAEVSSLKQKVNEYSLNETTMQERMKQMTEEYNEISKSLKVVNSEKVSMESHIQDLVSQLTTFETESKSKDEKIVLLKKEAVDLKEFYNVKLQEVENCLSSSNAEISSLKLKLDEYFANETTMRERMKQMTEEYDDVSKSLKIVNSEKASVESHIQDLVSQLAAVQTENKTKDEKIILLEKETADLKEIYSNKIQELENCLCSSNTEVSSLKQKLNEYSVNEITMQERMKQMTEEYEEISKSLKAVNSQKASMESHIQDLVSQLTTFETESKSKDEKIILLKKEAEDLKEFYNNKIQELENCLCSSNAEVSSLKEKVNEYSVNETTMQERMKQMTEEYEEISKLLKAVKSEKASMESHIQDLVSQLTTFETESKSKDQKIILLKKEAEDLKEFYNVKLQEVENCLSSSNAEISSLKLKLDEYFANETTMQERMKQMTEEYDDVSKSLKIVNSEKASVESHIQDLVSQLAAVQTENKTKDEKIILLEKETADLKEIYSNKIQELENCLCSSNTEVSSLKQKLNEYSVNEATMQERMKQMTEEYEEISKSLKIVNSEKASIESHIQDLVSQLTAVQTEKKTKDEKIILLEKETAELKEIYSVELMELQQTLNVLKSENESLQKLRNEFIDNENHLKQALEEIKKEKENYLGTLESERKKLESKVEELKNKISELEYDVIFDVGNELLLKTEINILKENYEGKILDFKNTMEALKSDNEKLLNQVKDFVLSELSVRQSLESSENEKSHISSALLAETKKTQMLHCKVVTLTNNLMNQEYFLTSKIANELILKSEMENIKKHFESKILELGQFNEALTLKVCTLQQQLNESSAKEASLIKRLQEINTVSQNDSLLNTSEDELKTRIDYIICELNEKKDRINSLESELSLLIHNTEDKTSELLLCKEFLESRVTVLQQDLENSYLEKTSLAMKLEEANAKCEKLSIQISSENEFKKRVHCLLTELNEKNERIKYLELEITLIKATHEEEKCQMNTNIGDVKSSILSVVASMNSILAQNEALQNEICSIKEEWKKTQIQMAEDQKARLDFFYGLLDQMNTLESHVEILVEKYEDDISHLKDELKDMESLIFVKNDDYENILVEKFNLQQEYKQIQEKINEKELQLKEMVLLKNEQLIAMENLSTTNEKLMQENKLVMDEISHLKNELREMESLIVTKNGDYESILVEKSNLQQECKQIEEKLHEKELQLQEMVLFKNEQLIAMENLSTTNEKLMQENKLFMDDILELKKTFCEMESQMLTKSQEYEVILKENQNLHEKVKLIEDRLNEKETEFESYSSEVSNVLKRFEEVKKTLTLENRQLQEENASLKRKLVDDESGLNVLKDKYQSLDEENTILVEKVKLLQEEVSEKENSLLSAKEKLASVEYTVNFEKETFLLEKNELKDEISHLKNELREMESLIVTKNGDYESILVEKSNLQLECKQIEEKLHEKELQLQEMVLFKNEQLIAMENLSTTNEKLMQENKLFMDDILELKKTFCEMESQMLTKSQEYEVILKENQNLHEKVKLIEDRLNKKETEFESYSSEVSNVLKRFEEVKKTLTLENRQLQEENASLKRKLVDDESGLNVLKDKYQSLDEENTILVEKVKLLQEEVSEKENSLLSAKEKLASVEYTVNFEKETFLLEKNELKLQVSLLCEILTIAENTLYSINSKFTDVLLNSKYILKDAKAFQQLSFETPKDWRNFRSDSIRDKNDVQTKRTEIETVYQFVSESLQYFQEHFTNCQNMDIPESVMLEIENIDSSEAKFKDPNSKCVTFCAEDAHLYSSMRGQLVTKFKDEVISIFKNVLGKFSLLEKLIVTTKDTFKFLSYHQLIANHDFRKMCMTLKYMKKLYAKVHSKKLVFETVWKSSNFLSSEYEFSENVFTFMNLFSDNYDTNDDVNLFFEKCLLVNTYKELYVASRLKKIFNSFKSLTDAEISKFEQHLACFKQYDHIDYHYLHKPIIVKMDYLSIFPFILKVDAFHTEKKIRNKIVIYDKNFAMLDEIRTILDNIKAAKIPLILNCFFRLCEMSSSDINENSVNTNLISCIVKKLVFFYGTNHCFRSLETSTVIENFLYLLSKVLAHDVTKENLKLFQNLMYLLIKNLLLSIDSLNNEKEADLFDMSVKEVDYLNSKTYQLKNEIYSLQELLKCEKEKSQALNSHSKETEENLSSVIKLKENWERKVLEISKLCSVLKRIFDCDSMNDCDILKLQAECATLSGSFCLCKQCLISECESQSEIFDHTAFTPVNLIHFVAELHNSKCDYKRRVVELKATNMDLNQKIINLECELKDMRLESSIHNQSISDLKERLNVKEYELENMKKKYLCLETEYENLNRQFSNTSNGYKNLQKTLDDKLNELNKCKHDYQEMSYENQRIKDEIILKELKISQCEKTILEKTSEYELLTVKAKDYEAKIDNLSSTINNLTSHLGELNNKVSSLEKAKSLLNTTLENVEEELQNTYTEKQKLEENIQEKINEIERLQQEVSLTNDKKTDETNKVSDLQITIKELEECLQNNEKKLTELQNKNHKLQNEISCSTKHINDLKVSIIEKDCCIQKNNSTIIQLKKVISDCDNEKKNLEVKIMDLKNELEEKIILSYNLEDNFSKIVAEKEELEKQITDLLSFKHEKLKMLENEGIYKTKYDQLSSENLSLKLEIENLTQEQLNLESKIKSYCDKVYSVESELKKAIKIQENLSCENDSLNKKLRILKGDMQVKDKSQLESSLLIQQLTQKVDKLRKEISDNGQNAAMKITELSQENASLLTEINILKSQQKIDNRNYTNSSIELPNFKSSENLEILKKFITFLIETIKKIECNSDIAKIKTELLSHLANWENNTKNLDLYTSDIFKKLHIFLQHYINRQKDLESKVDIITKAVIKYVSRLNKYCESEELTNNFNLTALGDISYLNETLCTDNIHSNIFTNCDINKLVHEMQKNCDILDTHFSSMRTLILKKDMEIKSLQDDLSELQQLKDSQPHDKQNSDMKVQDPESKCQLLLANLRRLDKKHNRLLKTCEEMEKHIKTLEKEKEELETEAEEMASLLRNQTSSDELLEMSMRLAQSTKQLENLREENSCLKSTLIRYESFVKENSLSMSKVAEQSQSYS